MKNTANAAGQPGGAALAIVPRSDLMKCHGAQLPACSRCIRKLAPISPNNQRWTSVDINCEGRCHYFADVNTFAALYVSPGLGDPVSAET